MTERSATSVDTPESVRQSFSNLIESCQDAVIFIDAEGSISFFNRAAERVFGFSREEVLHKNVRMLMPKPYRSEHDGYIKRYQQTGERRAIGRIRRVQARRKSGEIFPIELSVTELRINDHVRFGAFVRDVTEELKLQRTLIEQERRSAVGLSTSVFAHEVGNPLNNMLLHAQLLERALKRDEHPLGESATVIMQELRRLARLLDEFRQYGRPPDMTREAVDVPSLIKSTAEHHLLTSSSSHIVVKYELAEGLPSIDANRDKLQQVLLNLGKNAIEAMPGGGTLTFRARAERDAVEIDVVDTGLGISPDINVFQPFKTTKANGTGLGLPLVEQIIRLHGGSISYVSEPEVGTTFSVRLPTYSYSL